MEIKTPEAGKEYYKWDYNELCWNEGEHRALQIVQMYQLQPYVNIPCVKNGRLLSTYKDIKYHLETNVTKNSTLLDRQCSIFDAPVTNIKSQKVLTLRQIGNLIKSSTFALVTTNLRLLSKKEEKNLYKRTQFCYATFSGIFYERFDHMLVQHSGLICIDMDNLNESLDEVRTLVNSDPETVMSFVSPTGQGLKVLFEVIPGDYTQEEYYQGCSVHLSNLCRIPINKIDKSCYNVSRACFLPHDSELYINPILL